MMPSRGERRAWSTSLSMVASFWGASVASIVSASGPPSTPQNRVWPSDLVLETAEEFSAVRQEVCRRSGSRAEEASTVVENAVLAGALFTPSAGWSSRSPGGEGQALDQLLKYRVQNGMVPSALAKVGESCSPAKNRVEAVVGFYEVGEEQNPDDVGKCSREWSTYYLGLFLPYLAPLCLGGLCVLLHFTCCFVACCRCCRRCICCKERGEPRYSSKSKVIFVLALWIGVAVSLFGIGITVNALAFTMHATIDWQLCTGFQLVEEAIYGTTRMRYLGTSRALGNLEEMASTLDFDNDVTKLIRTTFQETGEFAKQQDKLQKRLSHFEDVLKMSGPGFRAFEHRCVFCSLAIGDPQNVIIGFPQTGLLPALMSELNASSSQSMVQIRSYISDVFIGPGLEDLASRVKRAIGAMNILDSALRVSLVETWAQRLPSIDVIESLRIAFFVCLGFLSTVAAVIGTLSFFITKVRARALPDRAPSGKVHCCSWCCLLFFVASGALLLTGVLILFTVFAGEGCIFLRREVFNHEGIARYADLLGLRPTPGGGTAPSKAVRDASAYAAVEIARSCFASNGTGDMLLALGLGKSLEFQPPLSDALYKLDGLVAKPALGERSAEYVEILRDAASRFGGMFTLDPLPVASPATTLDSRSATVANGTLGILALNPNVGMLMIGSTLVPEKVTGPDGRFKEGLNSFASLIAGPGKYTFLHGTAGGGYIITPDLPSASELAALPPTTQNALLYGRAKEHLLASNRSFRCDTLDEEGNSEVRLCGVSAFKDFVSQEVALMQKQMDAASAEARRVEHYFLSDLRADLISVLRRIKELRTLSNCRFLWARIEALDQALCEDVAPNVATSCVNLMALASVAAVGTIIQYKVWRHLKDNKVVGQELARFETTHSRFSLRIQELEDERQRREIQLKAEHQQALEEGFTADGTKIKDDDGT
mmetsp:Transcript_89581/g.256632  ORF Transcript_89581/g.256632 Transcript_89581/m.256632 type:complete len:940 (+) Transcript_89581:77-2896(+)